MSLLPEKLSYIPLTLFQWLTTSIFKNKTNGNLLIFCQSTFTYLLPVHNGDIRKGPNSEYLLSKVNFPAKSAI